MDYDRSHLVDGECAIVPVGKHHQLSCCDCGLVHDIWPSYDPIVKMVSIMFVRNSKTTQSERARLKRNRTGVFKRWPKRSRQG